MDRTVALLVLLKTSLELTAISVRYKNAFSEIHAFYPQINLTADNETC
jgi:hypothetical protein